jgi:hypothetical protein
MSKFIIDMQARQLTMLDARFYYAEGSFFPSVTTILEAYPKDAAYFKWIKEVGTDADTIRDEAGRRGSVVHDLTERYDNGEEVSLLNINGNLQFKMSEWSMFERYVDFVTRFKPDYIMNEQNFVSPALGYAGTIDRLAWLDGKLTLIDIKTSNNIHDSYWLQLAAYAALVHNMTDFQIEQYCILHLNAKTRTNGTKGAVQGIGWQLLKKDLMEAGQDYELFLVTKKLWEAQNKDAKPRQVSYTLTHKKPSDAGVQ